PVDLVSLLEPVFATLPDLVRGAGTDPTWTATDAFVATLLGDHPAAIVEALTTALAAGAPLTALSQAVSYPAALRVAPSPTATEFPAGTAVPHPSPHATPAPQPLRRAPPPELVRGLYHGAMPLSPDRFLTTPAARLPEDRPSDLASLPTDAD